MGEYLYKKKIHPKTKITKVFMKTKKEVFEICKSNGKVYCIEKKFSKKFPELYLELMTWNFPDNFKFSQKLYHYFNEDKELKLGICTVCGKRCEFLGFNKTYTKTCSYSCAQLDINTKNKIKQTNLEKYGVENVFQANNIKNKIRQTCLEKYGVDNYAKTEDCHNKMKQTCLEKYGKEYYTQTEEYKKKSKETNIKIYGVDNYTKTEEYKKKSKETNIKKYGVDNYAKTQEYTQKVIYTNNKKFGCDYFQQSNKFKQTNLKKYGVEYYTQTEDYKRKNYNTKKKNNSFHTSKIEEELTNWFKDNNYNFIRQYKDKRYPFARDFYLVNYDLFVEIQGSWTHGHHPFDENDINDIEQLNLWKEKNTEYYNNAIKVWTIRDVEKRNIAKKNNLNYLEIFSTDFNTCINKILNIL